MWAEPARRSEPAPAETIVLLSGEKAAESTGPPVRKHVIVVGTRAAGLGEPASQHRATVCSVLTQCVIHLPTDSLTYYYLLDDYYYYYY